jgi:hypothetical protein
MTTKIHIVNFGPQAVDVILVNPDINEETPTSAPTLYTQQSTDMYIHSGQAVRVEEV